MKKGKYIDITIMMACLSHKKTKPGLQGIDELLQKACAPLTKQDKKETAVKFTA